MVVAGLLVLAGAASWLLWLAASWVSEQGETKWPPASLFLLALSGLMAIVALWSLAWAWFGGLTIVGSQLIHRTWLGRRQFHQLSGRHVALKRTKTNWLATVLLFPILLSGGAGPIDRSIPWDGEGRPWISLEGLPDLDLQLFRLELGRVLLELQSAGALLDQPCERFLQEQG